MQNYCFQKLNETKGVKSEIDFIEAQIQILMSYNSMISSYMLNIVSDNCQPEVLFLKIVKLRTLLSKMSFIQNKIQSQIEETLRQESSVH